MDKQIQIEDQFRTHSFQTLAVVCYVDCCNFAPLAKSRQVHPPPTKTSTYGWLLLLHNIKPPVGIKVQELSLSQKLGMAPRISVRCIDGSGQENIPLSGEQILNLWARFDIVEYFRRLEVKNTELEKKLLDDLGSGCKVVDFDLDEEMDAATNAFLREVITSSWKMQREIDLPLGATHIINLHSDFFQTEIGYHSDFKKSEFTSPRMERCMTNRLTRLVRSWFGDEIGSP